MIDVSLQIKDDNFLWKLLYIFRRLTEQHLLQKVLNYFTLNFCLLSTLTVHYFQRKASINYQALFSKYKQGHFRKMPLNVKASGNTMIAIKHFCCNYKIIGVLSKINATWASISSLRQNYERHYCVSACYCFLIMIEKTSSDQKYVFEVFYI